MVRLIAGIVVGYFLFAFSALVTFNVLGQDAHANATPAVMVGTIGVGLIAAFVGGYVGAIVARGRERTAGLGIAFVIAAIAASVLLTQPAGDARWSPLSALVMAPVAALSSVIRSRRVGVR